MSDFVFDGGGIEDDFTGLSAGLTTLKSLLFNLTEIV